MMRRLLLLAGLIFFCSPLFAQKALIKGTVTDSTGNAVELATVGIQGKRAGTTTDKSGKFKLEIPARDSLMLIITYVGYKDQIRPVYAQPDEVISLQVELEHETREIDVVEIKSKNQDGERIQISTTKIDPKHAKLLPSGFDEFNKIIGTMPGVTSGNELSSSYSVRGGNFDENMVYVNGMQIYRPFLVRSGRQQGLSFVNSDLVEDVSFSSGGWQAKYGDRLSSVLNVTYKKPEQFGGSVTGSMLGGSAHIEGASEDDKINFMVGYRYKNSKYLLNTLPVEGEYFPRFHDLQTYVNFDLSDRDDTSGESKTSLEMLASLSDNKYLVEPTTRETTFGTLGNLMRVIVAFEGKEELTYNTVQGGLKLNHWVNPDFKTEFYVTGMRTRESEAINVEGGYRLCDVNTDMQSDDFNQCEASRGVGTQFNYARNSLVANVLSARHRGYWYRTNANTIEWGLRYSREMFDDILYEYGFVDSADYVTVSEPVSANHQFAANRLKGYVQSKHKLDSLQTFTYGARFNYWDFDNEFSVSPSLQYSYKLPWQHDVVFNAAAGIYRQAPFYRTLRNIDGDLVKNAGTQNSLHLIAGTDYQFEMWNRPFKLTSEVYYKYLWDVIPYEVNNLRVRYYAHHKGVAYATGFDFRVSGEFIPGSQSWFSLGALTTRENIKGDEQGYVRRPTDRRINAGIFFQDNLPNNPSVKMYLNLLFSSGIPFGIPGDLKNRTALSRSAYKRVDIGVSKLISFNDKSVVRSGFFESIWAGVEILNVLGVSNTISHIWVKDVNNQRYAIPNTLSQRYFNLKLIAEF